MSPQLVLIILLLQFHFSLSPCRAKPDNTDQEKSDLSLEQMLIGLKTSPPQTAADFLASFVSHYGVPIFRGPYQSASLEESNRLTVNSSGNCETAKIGNQSELTRQYWSGDQQESLSVWIPSKSATSASMGRVDSSSQLVSISMRDIARSANCEPEMQTVQLSRLASLNGGDVVASGADPQRDLYFPHCIRVPRCGGCCPSQRLRCTAQHVKHDNVMVMHVKYSTREHRFQFYGVKQVPVERHLQCACECIQREADCQPGQTYQASECRCVCPAQRRSECLQRQQRFTLQSRFLVWNETHCQCQCKAPSESMQQCPLGFRFNHANCRCEIVVSKASWLRSRMQSKREPVQSGPHRSRFSVWLQPGTAAQLARQVAKRLRT